MSLMQQANMERGREASAGMALAIPALFRQMGHELHNLHAMVARMEASIDGMVEIQSAALDAESIRNLQLLDIVGQTLNALSICCQSASALADPGWAIDSQKATESLTLASLAARLAHGVAPTDDPESASAYEMFSDD